MRNITSLFIKPVNLNEEASNSKNITFYIILKNINFDSQKLDFKLQYYFFVIRQETILKPNIIDLLNITSFTMLILLRKNLVYETFKYILLY